MKTQFPEGSILSHAYNFRWNLASLEQQYREDENSFLDWEILRDVVITYCKNSIGKELSPAERLDRVLQKIYVTIKRSELASKLFCDESPLAGHVYDAYVFTVCSSFLHTSKRVGGMSISEFVKKNHPLDFSNPDSPNFRNTSLLESEIDRLRKFRQRLLNQGQVYIKQGIKWNAITKDNEYEWTRSYALEDDNTNLHDIDKSIGNLYKGIREAINSDQDDKYSDRVQVAYKKFLSKLRKLKYEDFLKLYNADLARICKNKEHYGLNLYRLERRLQPYKIMNEVKRLTECTSPEEEANLLLKTVWLDEICFPKIYEYLLHYSYDRIERYAEEFLYMWKTEPVISNLVLDILVEEKFFGEDWYTLFLNKVNNMTEEVLYTPEKVEFFTSDYAQEKFIRLLHAGVFVEICVACNSRFHITDLLIN